MNIQYNIPMMYHRMNGTPEAYIVLLISVTPINSIKIHKRKENPFFKKSCIIGIAIGRKGLYLL